VEDILDVISGKKAFPGWVPETSTTLHRLNTIVDGMKHGPQGDPKFLAAFQKDIN